MPDSCAISMSPIHRAMTPAMVMQRLTASPAPVSYTHLDVYKRQVYTEITFVHLSTQCHADCCGNALSQGSGGHIHAWDMDAGMALQVGT